MGDKDETEAKRPFEGSAILEGPLAKQKETVEVERFATIDQTRASKAAENSALAVMFEKSLEMQKKDPITGVDLSMSKDSLGYTLMKSNHLKASLKVPTGTLLFSTTSTFEKKNVPVKVFDLYRTSQIFDIPGFNYTLGEEHYVTLDDELHLRYQWGSVGGFLCRLSRTRAPRELTSFDDFRIDFSGFDQVLANESFSNIKASMRAIESSPTFLLVGSIRTSVTGYRASGAAKVCNFSADEVEEMIAEHIRCNELYMPTVEFYSLSTAAGSGDGRPGSWDFTQWCEDKISDDMVDYTNVYCKRPVFGFYQALTPAAPTPVGLPNGESARYFLPSDAPRLKIMEDIATLSDVLMRGTGIPQTTTTNLPGLFSGAGGSTSMTVMESRATRNFSNSYTPNPADAAPAATFLFEFYGKPSLYDISFAKDSFSNAAGLGNFLSWLLFIPPTRDDVEVRFPLGFSRDATVRQVEGVGLVRSFGISHSVFDEALNSFFQQFSVQRIGFFDLIANRNRPASENVFVRIFTDTISRMQIKAARRVSVASVARSLWVFLTKWYDLTGWACYPTVSGTPLLVPSDDLRDVSHRSLITGEGLLFRESNINSKVLEFITLYQSLSQCFDVVLAGVNPAELSSFMFYVFASYSIEGYVMKPLDVDAPIALVAAVKQSVIHVTPSRSGALSLMCVGVKVPGQTDGSMMIEFDYRVLMSQLTELILQLNAYHLSYEVQEGDLGSLILSMSDIAQNQIKAYGPLLSLLNYTGGPNEMTSRHVSNHGLTRIFVRHMATLFCLSGDKTSVGYSKSFFNWMMKAVVDLCSERRTLHVDWNEIIPAEFNLVRLAKDAYSASEFYPDPVMPPTWENNVFGITDTALIGKYDRVYNVQFRDHAGAVVITAEQVLAFSHQLSSDDGSTAFASLAGGFAEALIFQGLLTYFDGEVEEVPSSVHPRLSTKSSINLPNVMTIYRWDGANTRIQSSLSFKPMRLPFQMSAEHLNKSVMYTESTFLAPSPHQWQGVTKLLVDITLAQTNMPNDVLQAGAMPIGYTLNLIKQSKRYGVYDTRFGVEAHVFRRVQRNPQMPLMVVDSDLGDPKIEVPYPVPVTLRNGANAPRGHNAGDPAFYSIRSIAISLPVRSSAFKGETKISRSILRSVGAFFS